MKGKSMGCPGVAEPPVVDAQDAPSLTEEEREHLGFLVDVGATSNHPARGVDFGELKYRVLGRLIARGMVKKARLYYYGPQRTLTAYWPTVAGRVAAPPTNRAGAGE